MAADPGEPRPPSNSSAPEPRSLLLIPETALLPAGPQVGTEGCGSWAGQADRILLTAAGFRGGQQAVAAEEFAWQAVQCRKWVMAVIRSLPLTMASRPPSRQFPAAVLADRGRDGEARVLGVVAADHAIEPGARPPDGF